ncbi:hypothetical protein ACO2FA_13415 [Staphylococcus warneri]
MKSVLNLMRIVNGKIDQDNQVEANDDNLTDKDKEIRRRYLNLMENLI